jgi:hypothetical protein
MKSEFTELIGEQAPSDLPMPLTFSQSRRSAPAGILAWNLPPRNTGDEPADDHFCRLGDIFAGSIVSPRRETC